MTAASTIVVRPAAVPLLTALVAGCVWGDRRCRGDDEVEYCVVNERNEPTELCECRKVTPQRY